MKPTTRLALIGLALLGAFAHGLARAETNLPMVCTDPSAAGKPVNQACGGSAQTGQIYRAPRDTDLVRTMSDGKTSADWSSSAYVWKAWGQVKAGEYFDACNTDIPSGSPVPDGPCQDWSMRPRAGAPATFTATPTTGVAPLAITITWNVPNGSGCQAGGAWSGAKAASGTETITASTSGTLTLACAVPGPDGPGKATLTWTKPTQNTDGSTLTDLAGFNVYSGRSNPPTNKVSPMLGPNATSYVFDPITPTGVEWWFGIEAVNAAGAQSTPLTVASKMIAGTPTTTPWSAPPISLNVTAPVAKRPKAPTLTVQ